MTVNELLKIDEFTPVYTADGQREINGAYCGDLLSWVMGRGEQDNIFITIMTNINVIAVASLIDFSAVVFAENAELSEDVITAAQQKGINLVKTALSSYNTCVLLSKMI